jgi:hypothetical protein
MSAEMGRKRFGKELAEASYSIRPDDESPWGYIINTALRKAGRTERFRKISTEAAVVAEGIWTMENAIRITGGIKVQTGSSGGEYFRASPKDFEQFGSAEDNFETFWVEPEVIKILIDGGVFKRKPDGSKYMMIYPPGYAEECGVCGVFVEMTHRPREGDVHSRESMTLHFMS